LFPAFGWINWLSDTYTPWFDAVMLIFEFDAAPIAVVGVAVDTADVPVRDRQPLIDTRTSAPIKSKGNAYLSGVLMYCFIVLATGFISLPLGLASAVTSRHQRDTKLSGKERDVTA